MKSKYEKILWERFGTPIGKMAGEPLVGVRDERSDLCASCGMMPIDGECDCSKELSEERCEGCGMPTEQCSCQDADVCPKCGMLPVNGACSCGSTMKESKNSACECGAMMEEGQKSCHECGMNQVAPPGKEKSRC